MTSVFLASFISLSGPGCASDPAVHVWSSRVGGVERYYDATAWSAHGELDALREQASIDLGCAREALVLSHYGDRETFVVGGCGKAGVFIGVGRRPGDRDVRRDLKSLGGRGAEVEAHRFVMISAGEAPLSVLTEIARADAFYETPDTGPTGANGFDDLMVVVHDFVALNAQGATDLACPREQVVPLFIAQGPKAPSQPVAEGCGQRATYLAEQHFLATPRTFKLSAVVKM